MCCTVPSGEAWSDDEYAHIVRHTEETIIISPWSTSSMDKFLTTISHVPPPLALPCR
jgi:hypothetical protein